MKLRHAVMGGLIASLDFVPVTVLGIYAADPAKPSISEEAAGDLLHMGQTLRADEFSVQVKRIRVYADPNGEPLHIFHSNWNFNIHPADGDFAFQPPAAAPAPTKKKGGKSRNV